MLSYNDDAKASLLKEWFYFDESKNDDLDRHQKKDNDATNLYNIKHEKIKNGTKFHFEIPMFVDIYQVSRHLLPGVNQNISLTRSNDNFYIMAPEAQSSLFRFCIENLQIRVQTCGVIRSFEDDVNALLLKGVEAKIPLVSSSVNFISQFYDFFF